MAITDDIRKTLTDPTPLYSAAGTADLAAQKLKEVPALVEQLARRGPGAFRGRAQHRPEGRPGARGDRRPRTPRTKAQVKVTRGASAPSTPT